MSTFILINILWPPLAFFACIALGKLFFGQPKRRNRRR